MKNVKTERDVDGAVALEIRLDKGENQTEFWARIGVSQAAGCRYETDKQHSMRTPIRRLFYAQYIAGLEIEAETPGGAREIKRLAKFQKSGDKA